MISAKKAWSVVLFLTTGVLSSYTYGQDIRFAAEQMTLLDAFRQIESQTDYLISYPASRVDLDAVVTFPANTLSLEQALREMVKNTRLKYDIRGNHILISGKEPETEDLPETAAPSRTLSPDTGKNRRERNPCHRPGRKMIRF